MDKKALVQLNEKILAEYVPSVNSIGPVQTGFFNGNTVLFVGQNPGNKENWPDFIRELVPENLYFDLFKSDEYEMSKFLKAIYPEKHWKDISWTNVYKTAFRNHEVDIVDDSWHLAILKQQIDIIKPKFIVGVGVIAREALKKIGFADIIFFNHWSYLKKTGAYDIEIKKYRQVMEDFVFKEYIVHCANLNKKVYVRYDFWERKIKEFDFKNYFYVDSLEGDHISWNGLKVKRIYDEDPKSYQKTYEADVYSNIRYLIDKKCRFIREQKIGFFDIETNESLDVMNASKEILSISLIEHFKKMCWIWRDDLKKEVIQKDDAEWRSFDSETEMIRDFIKYFANEQFDVLTGWNADRFDFPYLFKRIQVLGLNLNDLSCYGYVSFRMGETKDDFHARVYGTDLIDLLKVFKKITYDKKPSSFSLKNISEVVLGDKKMDIGRVGVAWKNNIELLARYNLKDSELIYRINEKSRLLDYMMTLQEISTCPLDLCLWNKNVVDCYLLKEYNEKLVFPTIVNNEKVDIEGAITGKIVFKPDGSFESTNPDKGMFKNVGVIDFSSMYPSIYRTFNVSPDTIDENGEILIDGIKFSNKKQGLIPAVFEELLKKRKYYEKLRDSFPRDSQEWYIYQNYQGGVKQIANSFFGITGYTRFRLYNPAITKTITFMGQQLIAFAWKKAEEKGYKILYADTDSIFVCFGDELTEDECIKKAEELEVFINSQFIDFIKNYMIPDKNFLKLECEKIFKKIIFTGVKKKYIGYLFYKKGEKVNEMFYRGIELVKRDTPKAFKVFLRKVIELLFEDNSSPLKYTNEFKLTIQKEYKLQDIAVLKNISKDLHEYDKTTPQHVKAARWSNDIYKTSFDKGDSVGIIYVKGKQTDVIGINEDFEALPRGVIIDWDRYFDNFVDGKLEMFCFLPQLRQQKSLFDFLGE